MKEEEHDGDNSHDEGCKKHFINSNLFNRKSQPVQQSIRKSVLSKDLAPKLNRKSVPTKRLNLAKYVEKKGIASNKKVFFGRNFDILGNVVHNENSDTESGIRTKPDMREECVHCGRLFNVEIHAKHMELCRSVFMTKRSIFDSRLQRTKRPFNKEDEKVIVRPESQWELKSDIFREAIRNGKKKIEMGDGLFDDRVLCPNCFRKFNAMAAVKHIPGCKN